MLNNKLDNFESPVRTELWQNIASQIGSGTATGTGSGGSFITSAIGKIIIAAAVVTGVVTTLILIKQDEKKLVVTEHPPVSTNANDENNEIKTEEINSSVGQSAEEVTVTQVDKVKEKPNQKSPISTPTPNNQDTNVNGIDGKSGKNLGFTPSASPTANKEESNIIAPESTANNQPEDFEEEKITAQFSVKSADPEHLKFFLFASNIGKLSYTWMINDEIKSNENNFSISFDEQGIYTVQLTVKNEATGEQATSNQEIKAYKPLKFDYPNAFSPGVNGKNDIIDFSKGCSNKSEMISVEVRNMNGQLVYKSETEFIWDGRNPQGGICPTGPYIYSVIAMDQFGEIQSKTDRIQLFSE